ncbi:MAG: hypothetical protein BroJett021_35040 [Chloroflexota bacterium]|nr:MAG: hypothetical protein BroJett021_35040 [Chloroflexota bacterium]
MNMSIRKATSKTLADYKAEVLRLVRKTGLSSGAAKALVAKEREYIAEMFNERGSESEAADEILRPSNARPSGDDDANTIVLSIPLSTKAGQYLKQLADCGLWGSTPEAVASVFIYQQIEAKFIAGFIPQPQGSQCLK